MNRENRHTTIAALSLAFAVLATPAAAADEKLDPDQLAFFETRIRPALDEHCYKCHAADSEKIKGGLLLDTRAGTLQGGDSGHAVVPGDLTRSLLFSAITYADEDMEMPPKYELDEEVIADFEKWILMGAPDPRKGGKKVLAAKTEIDIEKGREFWAYQPPVQPELPKTKNTDWAETEIDRFVLAGLEENDLSPSADADKRTLIRRIYFDLIGLPPTPKEVEDFVADKDPEAFRKVVDGLLQMDQFGERWGRHWLDVARYAESMRARNPTSPSPTPGATATTSSIRLQRGQTLRPLPHRADRRRLSFPTRMTTSRPTGTSSPPASSPSDRNGPQRAKPPPVQAPTSIDEQIDSMYPCRFSVRRSPAPVATTTSTIRYQRPTTTLSPVSFTEHGHLLRHGNGTVGANARPSGDLIRLSGLDERRSRGVRALTKPKRWNASAKQIQKKSRKQLADYIKVLSGTGCAAPVSGPKNFNPGLSVFDYNSQIALP